VSLHPEVDLVDPFTGHVVGIDEEMVPIIEALWSLGIETSECCQGFPRELIPPNGSPAVICFAAVGRMDEWGRVDVWGGRFRFRKSRQWAPRLAVILAGAAPDDRWRRWRWDVDDFNRSSGVVLPNEDLPWLAAQLGRVERAAAGQLTLEEAQTSAHADELGRLPNGDGRL
jgi:hypothetical protein